MNKEEYEAQFEPDEEIAEAVEALMAYCSEQHRGAILTHDKISQLITCEKGTGRWNTIVTKFRKRLLRERGIALISGDHDRAVRGFAFRLAVPSEQIVVIAAKHLRKAGNQHIRQGNVAKAVAPSELTTHMQNARALAIEDARKGRAACRRRARDLALLGKPQPQKHVTHKQVAKAKARQARAAQAAARS